MTTLTLITILQCALAWYLGLRIARDVPEIRHALQIVLLVLALLLYCSLSTRLQIEHDRAQLEEPAK